MHGMTGFARQATLLFIALRLGDAVNLAAGLWFVPRYVSPEEIGAVLPLSSFATFLSLPVFALAMTVMKETAWMSARGERGKVKSLLSVVFAAMAALLAAVLAAGTIALPRFLAAMRVSDMSAGMLVVMAAFLGCAAPVYSDALQAMKRFRALGAIEILGALARFAAMALAMPIKPLAGYFAGQAVLPAFRIFMSVLAVRRDLSVPAEPFWNRPAARRMSVAFFAILAYQSAPMLATLVEQSVLRTCCTSADSAGYYMASRFSDILHLLTFPLLLVAFPYTAHAAQNGESTFPYVMRCSATALGAAVSMAVVYLFFGNELMSLMPHGSEYLGYVQYMPWLVAITVLTACQVFYTNAEVSAGRFGFLVWFIPLHAICPAAMGAAARCGLIDSITDVLAWAGAAALLRFVFAASAMLRARQAYTLAPEASCKPNPRRKQLHNSRTL